MMSIFWVFLTLAGAVILFAAWLLQYLSGGNVLRELNYATVEHVHFNSWQNKYELILRKNNYNHKFYVSRQHFLILEIGYVVSVKYDDNFYIQEVRYGTT